MLYVRVASRGFCGTRLGVGTSVDRTAAVDDFSEIFPTVSSLSRIILTFQVKCHEDVLNSDVVMFVQAIKFSNKLVELRIGVG